MNERPCKPRPVQPKPSKPRTASPCPVADRCGGCSHSHVPYPEQLKQKQRTVEKLLSDLCPVEPIIGMENPWHYRSKVHAVIGTDRNKQPIAGVYARGTHHIVPVTHCLIEDERADAIIQTIVGMLPCYKLRIYNENTHRGFLRHVLVRTGHVTGQIMVVLVATASEFPGGKAFVAELIELHPEITTVVLNVNQKENSMVLGQKDYPLFGPGYLEDELCGKRFRISPQSFYQVNTRQTEILYQTALSLANFTGTETLLDAYCGTGTIGLCAADRVKQLIGVELNADAVWDAKVNARLNQTENAQFFCEDAGHFMVKMARENQSPDVLIMDPPRSGSDERFLSAVLTCQPRTIVYVSCNPETLARDVRYLVKGGYRAVKAVPVDMFPHTGHVETVMSLVQQKPDDIVKVGIDADELAVTKAESKATYGEIQTRVKEQTGLNVTPLYIAQVKRKHGIIERECYNKAKSEGSKMLICPPDKEKAIEEALRFFGMIA